MQLTSVNWNCGAEITRAGGWATTLRTFTSGPRLEELVGTMNSTSPWPLQWACSYWGNDNGPFSATLTLYPGLGRSDWSFLKDGVTDFTLANNMIGGWGGFASPPVFNLNQVTLVIDATPALPGDANVDGTVDINDLTVVLTNYGRPVQWTRATSTGDGTVDINDLTQVLTYYGTTYRRHQGCAGTVAGSSRRRCGVPARIRQAKAAFSLLGCSSYRLALPHQTGGRSPPASRQCTCRSGGTSAAMVWSRRGRLGKVSIILSPPRAA